jgi:hypothetical protein
MEPAVLAPSILPTVPLLKLVFVIVDTSLTLDCAHLLAMPSKNGEMVLANVKLDII